MTDDPGVKFLAPPGDSVVIVPSGMMGSKGAEGEKIVWKKKIHSAHRATEREMENN